MMEPPQPAVWSFGGRQPYGPTWELQRRLQQAVIQGGAEEYFLALEHSPVYTLGRGAREAHLLVEEGSLWRAGVEVHRIDRGGDVTYHGPGQLVGYPILRLTRLYQDLRRYLRDLEAVLIAVLAECGIVAGRNPGKTGVWVGEGADARKIAAIGVRVSRWVTMHGFALNVDPDLACFQKIIPCGIFGSTVTSLREQLGSAPPLPEVAACAARHLARVFHLTLREASWDALAGGAAYQETPMPTSDHRSLG